MHRKDHRPPLVHRSRHRLAVSINSPRPRAGRHHSTGHRRPSPVVRFGQRRHPFRPRRAACPPRVVRQPPAPWRSTVDHRVSRWRRRWINRLRHRLGMQRQTIKQCPPSRPLQPQRAIANRPRVDEFRQPRRSNGPMSDAGRRQDQIRPHDKCVPPSAATGRRHPTESACMVEPATPERAARRLIGTPDDSLTATSNKPTSTT